MLKLSGPMCWGTRRAVSSWRVQGRAPPNLSPGAFVQNSVRRCSDRSGILGHLRSKAARLASASFALQPVDGIEEAVFGPDRHGDALRRR
ncbi:hypothetical protein GOFOIKOB_3654 [Methylobacterium tardum]|uniref:Uncharacterized protein n=1 Tax=Methylobacterium tardum TaxID=374432 RepID=A0AA37WQT0_9HYPH|nr:hypothetical protein [Methylobacterium tardum]URD35450.1 hypothetical protein M6G65_23515 [Methylobacterium tardum]GJE50605.1 hypothetical protein GOFOIKOB_3654 [Methylobacterium tardum]GLS69234.1 hypothetical protein GCM10007890_12460 [Methylobacterium tardum]